MHLPIDASHPVHMWHTLFTYYLKLYNIATLTSLLHVTLDSPILESDGYTYRKKERKKERKEERGKGSNND